MSEYQYYEFQAVDRPLDAAEQAELRALSTRARITATGFVNHYEWGDLKADPQRLMERYFDLFLYLANWGTRRLSIRLPARLIDVGALERFCPPEWTPPVNAPSASRKGRERLSDMYEGWKKEQKPTDRLILERDIALNRFYRMHGDMEIAKITKGHIRQVKDRMVDGGLAATTINKQLSHVRAVLRFAVDNGYIDDNPGAGIGVRGAKRQTKSRLPYSVDDLNLIFSGPVHRDGKRPQGGGGEAAFWLPLIALYSGMRMEEIGQAYTTDLKQEGGATIPTMVVATI